MIERLKLASYSLFGMAVVYAATAIGLPFLAMHGHDSGWYNTSVFVLMGILYTAFHLQARVIAGDVPGGQRTAMRRAITVVRVTVILAWLLNAANYLAGSAPMPQLVIFFAGVLPGFILAYVVIGLMLKVDDHCEVYARQAA